MSVDEGSLVAWQLGRTPRGPWRVLARCEFGFPSVIASPPLLDDGDRFPTWAWLTCPWLARVCADLESQGATAAFAQRASVDEAFASGLRAADARVRRERAVEAGGEDCCADVGLAGQREPLGVKCLHAHVALALSGIDDPVGAEVLAESGVACSDRRCACPSDAGDGV